MHAIFHFLASHGDDTDWLNRMPKIVRRYPGMRPESAKNELTSPLNLVLGFQGDPLKNLGNVQCRGLEPGKGRSSED